METVEKGAQIRAAVVAAFAVAVVGIAAPAVGQDTTPPTLVSAEVNATGRTLFLLFNDDVTSDDVSETVDRFGLTVDGAAVRQLTVFEAPARRRASDCSGADHKRPTDKQGGTETGAGRFVLQTTELECVRPGVFAPAEF